MHRRNLIALSFLLAGSVLPVALFAQQPEAKPNENQVQPQTPPVQPERTPQQADQARQQGNRQAEDTRVNPDWTTRQAQTPPVQPERTPQQADQARQQGNRQAEDTRVNPNWTTRQRSDERMDMDRQRRMDQDRDDRTVGRHWRHDDEMDRGARYGARDHDDDRFYDVRPHRRVKICIEYDNGDEFCRYRD
jgi:hypothetical protein